ncbi:uncharacterized protein WCC33_014946 [Rhinophrynus dorsalis]
MSDLCRLCSSPLRGSRRKWLFGGSGSLPILYSHVLGSPVSRSSSGGSSRSRKGKGRPEDSEFLCGKCCHSLNVYHRYDLVMSRMRQLYERRSNRLMSEREKLAFTLRSIHSRAWGLPLPDYQGYIHESKSPGYHRSCHDLSSSSSNKTHRDFLSPGYQSSCPDSPFPGLQNSYHGSLGSLSPRSPSKPYQKLLDRDRSRWEHESWWEDKEEPCTHCAKGDRCQYCSSWRVPDSNYEMVCTVPRRRNHSGRGSEDGSINLHRSKSLGSFGGDSSRGSLLSFSTSSLERLSLTGEEEMGVFWEPPSPLASSPPPFLNSSKPALGEALKSLKEIKYSPVKTPGRSKIPVKSGGPREVQARHLNRRNGEESSRVEPLGEETDRESDVYMGIGSEICRTHVIRIRDTLNWLQTQMLTTQEDCNAPGQQDPSKGQQELIRELVKSLNFKEEVLEDCLTLLLNLPVTSDPAGANVETLIQKIREREQKMKEEADELAEGMRQSKAETGRLQLELKEREEDVGRLSRVLRENQDTITALRDLLSEKDFAIQQLEVALDSAVRSAASQDAFRLSALKEKDALINAVQVALSSSNQDVEALADSLLSHGLDDLSGSNPQGCSSDPLLAQLQEKSNLLSQAHANSQKQSIRHQRDIQDLLNALNESQTLLQDQLRYCKQRLQVGAQEQKTLREALRVREAELRTERQQHMFDLQKANIERAQLQGTASERDKTTQKLLQEAQSRDQTIKRLQERLSQGGVMRDTL